MMRRSVISLIILCYVDDLDEEEGEMRLDEDFLWIVFVSNF